MVGAASRHQNGSRKNHNTMSIFHENFVKPMLWQGLGVRAAPMSTFPVNPANLI
jgi:hypothetical protein